MTLESCCEWFANLMSDPGAKGFTVVPVHSGDKRFFTLEARAVDPPAVEELKKPPGPGRTPVSVAISMRLPLKYCPYCGSDYSLVIGKQMAVFDAEAERFANLLAVADGRPSSG